MQVIWIMIITLWKLSGLWSRLQTGDQDFHHDNYGHDQKCHHGDHRYDQDRDHDAMEMIRTLMKRTMETTWIVRKSDWPILSRRPDRGTDSRRTGKSSWCSRDLAGGKYEGKYISICYTFYCSIVKHLSMVHLLTNKCQRCASAICYPVVPFLTDPV